jgi:hypothetical protein
MVMANYIILMNTGRKYKIENVKEVIIGSFRNFIEFQLENNTTVYLRGDNIDMVHPEGLEIVEYNPGS